MRLQEPRSLAASQSTIPARPPIEVGFDYLEQFLIRAVQDAFSQASVTYWIRRAETFEAVGTKSADETALACRNHARLLAENPGQHDAEISRYYSEAS